VCGRFDRHSSLADFAHAIDGLLVVASEELSPSYNVAPSQRALVVRSTPEGRVASALVWGLVPSWVKKTKKNPPMQTGLPRDTGDSMAAWVRWLSLATRSNHYKVPGSVEYEKSGGTSAAL
jgi:hypothetical protein